jgi:isoquinoline 1-oxidoreductase beta subunit
VKQERALSRRSFLKTGAAGGAVLLIGFDFTGAAQVVAGDTRGPFSAWVRVASDGTVTLLIPKAEMGQGVMTGLAMLLAEELDVEWADVRVEQAPTDPNIYRHGTGSSSSTRTSWLPLRQAAAAARGLLVQAAARRWKEDPLRCRTEAGSVIGPTSQRARYADLVEGAALLPVPDLTKVPLKEPSQFQIIGRPIPRVDVPSKVDGSARFGIDVRLPGMLRAVVARCPALGGRVKRFDAAKAKAVAGVRHVVEIPSVVRDVFSCGGVAVVADNTWAALQGRQALVLEWEEGEGESSQGLSKQFELLLAAAGSVVRNDGDAAGALAGAAHRVEARYELPFVAHATMEPMNATVHVRRGGTEAWVPTQDAAFTREILARILGQPPEAVIVHTTLLGGGFGRRAATDFVVEAAQISRLVGAPVQVVWTREDDIQHDFYRPASMHHLSASLDARGRPTAWFHRMASTSIAAFLDPPETAKPAESEIGGAVDLPYAIPSIRMEYSPAPSHVPVSWWRSVENSVNAFVTECFLDELAGAAGIDPLTFRQQLLAEPRQVRQPPDSPAILETTRLRAVLERAALRAGWGTPVKPGHGRGLACHFSYRTYVAQVAEVSVAHGAVRVHRVHLVVDCGRVVNPDVVRAQMEGGVVFGLSAALKGAITIENGRVQQSNFNDFEVLRLPEAPEIDVEILASDAPPTGVGEPGLPPIAPAVANAVFAATGKRVRRLPIRL